MGHVSREVQGLTQKLSFDAVGDKNQSSSIGKGSSSEGKYKAAHSFGKPFHDPKSGRIRKSHPDQVVILRSLDSEQKSLYGNKTGNDDELVKHMSNLPGFLQKVEKESSIQEKALNFGVLDWKRLEKWRYNERMPTKHPKRLSQSSNSILPTGVQPKMVPNLRKHASSHRLNSGKQPMNPAVSRFFSPQRQPVTPQSAVLNSSKEDEAVNLEDIKFKGKETCNQEVQAAQSRPTNKQLKSVYRRVEFYNRFDSKVNAESDRKKDKKEELILEKEASPSEHGGNEFIIPPDDKSKCLGETVEARFSEAMNITSECCTTDLQVPLPKNFSRRSCSVSSPFTEARTSGIGHEETSGNRLSGCFSQMELYARDFSTDIPHSCPLPSGDVVEAEPSSGPLDAHFNPVQPEGTRGRVKEKHTRPSSSHEASGVFVPASMNGRRPSPTRRFSFSIGRMSKSFSFKESSEHPAGRFGPVSMDSSDEDKSNFRSKGRLSPLKRLLDPLLKYKGQMADSARLPHSRLNSMSSMSMRPTGRQDKKPVASTFQALLQLTLKNDVPSFKLVVDGSNDMLVAAVKRRPSSAKNDSCLHYAFYSVHEVKKKSTNWIGQGSKSKMGSLGYTMIGQMKLSGSSSCDLRECVLYSVEMGQIDNQTPELVANKEIAAIVVKNSIQKPDDGVTGDKDQLYAENDSLHVDEKDFRNSGGMVVIRPGGVHGIPINGSPSTLLDRWRSGGLCDCGGWDVGCKLRILYDDNKCNISAASAPLVSTDSVHLFSQGREQKSKPVFSLVPLKDGLYNIEMDSSMSLSEAFAIGVAYVTCRDFSEMIDTKAQSCTANSLESLLGADKMKRPTTFEGQLPEKFVTCPPLSPAGRI